MKSSAPVITAVIVLLAGIGAGLYIYATWEQRGAQNEYREVTEYRPPAPDPGDFLQDDLLEDKRFIPFDPELIDRRPIGEKGAFRVNSSAAVIKLDVPMILPEEETELLRLYPSYAAALRSTGRVVLPSVNMIDGKAKQFDDGLYAALDQAYYQGIPKPFESHVELVRQLFLKVDRQSPASAYLAAGLELAGVKVEPADAAAKDRHLQAFLQSEADSKPIGFYTWNETLSACFKFLRYFQRPFGDANLPIPRALAAALASDPKILATYQKAMAFYARLTNPFRVQSMADMLDLSGPPGQPAKLKSDLKGEVALFPASGSKEVRLFEMLFPEGPPPNVILMRELIGRIRSGEVKLAPGPDSGWYDRQVYALETLLLPEKAEEHVKLQLTRTYKKRMLEAFQALITKRRETHVRQLGIAKSAAMIPADMTVAPRLRLEPCPSFYLRTARAYAFLANFLESAVGKEGLSALHGLKQTGQRAPNLWAELHRMRDHFYGLYLVTCEDIGLKSKISTEEAVDEVACYRLATEWLDKAAQDEDLAVDTRVGVPIYLDNARNVTRLWCTLGVRLAKLDASYARPPHLRSAEEGDWQVASRLGTAQYLILVDEFAEVEIKGLRVLTRDELRGICDRHSTKQQIIDAIRKY